MVGTRVLMRAVTSRREQDNIVKLSSINLHDSPTIVREIQWSRDFSRAYPRRLCLFSVCPDIPAFHPSLAPSRSTSIFFLSKENVVRVRYIEAKKYGTGRKWSRGIADCLWIDDSFHHCLSWLRLVGKLARFHLFSSHIAHYSKI